MDPTALGVNVALEANRRGLLGVDDLSAVMAYYDTVESSKPLHPREVLGQFGVSEAKVLELIQDLAPESTVKFNHRLTIHETLGRGAMGVVSRAYDSVLRRVVAVKTITLGQVAPARRQLLSQRFQREAQVMARILHPGVAQLHDAGLDDKGDPYLVMELVPGRNLEELIEHDGPLDVRKVLRWGIVLAEALQACHVAGVVHRDVKPSNVLITPADGLKLVDFGVAFDEEAVTRLTATNAAVGTVLYMAPEQVRGEPCDARSDVYALGATLYHALSGRAPFEADHAALLLEHILRRPPDPIRSLRPDVPEAVDALLRRCLAKAPGARPPAAGLVATELRAVLASPARVRGPRPGRFLLSVGAVFLTAVVVGALVAIASSAKPPATRRPGAENVPASRSEGQPTGEPARTPPGPPASATTGTDRLELPAGIVVGTKPGEYVNTKDGSVLVFVPSGRFRMGHPSGETAETAITWSDTPSHDVTLSGYFIGKFEVTWAQYRAFAAETPSARLASDGHVLRSSGVEFRAKDDDPVFSVTWEQARAYCQWAGLRLPTEAEWEFAARGPRAEQLYPWGNDDPTPRRANIFGSDDGFPFVCRVGSFPKGTSPAGCQDMTGNVAEWVADFFGPYDQEPRTDPRGPVASTHVWDMGWRPLESGQGPLRVVRGGGWTMFDGQPPELRYYKATRRGFGVERQGHNIIGFRVGRDAR